MSWMKFSRGNLKSVKFSPLLIKIKYEELCKYLFSCKRNYGQQEAHSFNGFTLVMGKAKEQTKVV